jgi:hypothetical protein
MTIGPALRPWVGPHMRVITQSGTDLSSAFYAAASAAPFGAALPFRKPHIPAMMRVPECELLGAMGRTEGVVDIENLQPARLHRGAELIEQSRGEPRTSILLGAFSRRLIDDCDASGCPLSGQRPITSFISGSCLSQSRSMASCARRRLRRRAPSPFRTSRTGHGRYREGPASLPQAAGIPPPALRFPQQQQTGIGLGAAGAAIKIHGEFLAADRWQVAETGAYEEIDQPGRGAEASIDAAPTPRCGGVSGPICRRSDSTTQV